MNSVCRDIFRAVHEGVWLSIEYQNKAQQVTKYWIGIKNILPHKRALYVDGLHLGQHEIRELYIYIDSIRSCSILEGTYQPKNRRLIDDIAVNPQKYRTPLSWMAGSIRRTMRCAFGMRKRTASARSMDLN